MGGPLYIRLSEFFYELRISLLPDPAPPVYFSSFQVLFIYSLLSFSLLLPPHFPVEGDCEVLNPSHPEPLFRPYYSEVKS